jgi:hypothetical protein
MVLSVTPEDLPLGVVPVVTDERLDLAAVDAAVLVDHVDGRLDRGLGGRAQRLGQSGEEVDPADPYGAATAAAADARTPGQCRRRARAGSREEPATVDSRRLLPP